MRLEKQIEAVILKLLILLKLSVCSCIYSCIQLIGDKNTSLSDICFKPLEPDVDACTIQSINGWWQGSEELLNKTNMAAVREDKKLVTYLDHAVYCSK